MILKKKNFFIFKNLSQQVFLSISINNLIKKKIKIFDSKKMYITYESQLFQKNIIYELKKKYKRLKIIGYDHTAPQPLPINLFHDKYSPDFLIVNSKNKFDFNHKYLGWPKNKMKIMKSFRFRIIKKDFQLKIFLPYVLNDQETYIIKMINLMKILKIKDLKSFKIKIHPACKKKIKHLNFIKKLKKLKNLEFKNNNKNKNNNIVVFLGQTTAIPIAIESKLDCYNICLDPNFDVYNPKIWSGIKCNEIDNNIYLYKLKKKKSLIWIDKEYNNFNKLKI